jgi:hypothetical protein
MLPVIAAVATIVAAALHFSVYRFLRPHVGVSSDLEAKFRIRHIVWDPVSPKRIRRRYVLSELAGFTGFICLIIMAWITKAWPIIAIGGMASVSGIYTISRDFIRLMKS